MVVGQVRGLLQGWAGKLATATRLQAQQVDMMERVKASAFTDAAAAEADKSRPNQCAAAQMGSLVAHVIGEGSGWSGASRLRYLHEFRFEPFNPAKPQGRGQAWVTLADGCGVFMVVLVKDLGFVKTSTQRPQQTATKEFKRREKKRGAVAAVLRAAAAFESQCIHSSTSSSSPCAIVFAALCCSHAGRTDCTPPPTAEKTHHVSCHHAISQ
jgi:hypothetical protein